MTEIEPTRCEVCGKTHVTVGQVNAAVEALPPTGGLIRLNGYFMVHNGQTLNVTGFSLDDAGVISVKHHSLMIADPDIFRSQSGPPKEPA